MGRKWICAAAAIAAVCLLALCAHACADEDCPICLLRAAVGSALPYIRTAAAAAVCAFAVRACERRTGQVRTVVTDKVVMLS